MLSSSFTAKAPRKIYILHNDATGQTIVIDKSTLLGRKPSMDVPEGAKAEKVEDPTRTTSRNHAAISIDQNGTLWIEDYGSLNGTYIIRDGQEAQVLKGKPRELRRPRHAAYRRPVLPTHRAPVAALHYPSCEIPSGESPIQRRKTGL